MDRNLSTISSVASSGLQLQLSSAIFYITGFRSTGLPYTVYLSGSMTPLQCKLELNVMESSQLRGLALGEQVRIAFEMSVTNPVMTPDIVEDYWRMELWHGTSPPYPFSGGLAESWPVYGTLDNLTVSLVGFERRAGAMSDLRFDFVPSAQVTCRPFGILQ